jgi:hypothetical protein
MYCVWPVGTAGAPNPCLSIIFFAIKWLANGSKNASVPTGISLIAIIATAAYEIHK